LRVRAGKKRNVMIEPDEPLGEKGHNPLCTSI